MNSLTNAQKEALEWLQKHNGDGLFDRNGMLVAGGERAPFMRSTWNALRDAGLLEFYGKRPDGTGRGRARIIKSEAAGAELERVKGDRQ